MLLKQRSKRLSTISSKLILATDQIHDRSRSRIANPINLNVRRDSKFNNERQASHMQVESSHIGSNEKIESLTNELYPLLTQLGAQIERKTSHKSRNDLLFDDYTSQRELENKMSMNSAQRELDRRLKNRVLQKSKKGSIDMPESYIEAYKKIQSGHKLRVRTEMSCPQYQEPEVSPQGINYYNELRTRPIILKYAEDMMRRKRLNQGLQKRIDLLTSTPILKSLSARKRNKTQVKMEVQQKWARDIYNQGLSNIDRIGLRLKKLYFRNSNNLGSKEINQIQHSRILQHQQHILQDLGEDYSKISQRNKTKLITKFNKILEEYGKCSKKDLINSHLRTQNLRLAYHNSPRVASQNSEGRVKIESVFGHSRIGFSNF